MTNFDYKKYSLENLEKWIEDALSSAEASPQEIYDTIHKVVSENYYHHKHHASRAYELMEKLNGGVTFISCDKDDKSPECQKSWSDFWEENYYPEESSQYTEEELNAMCDKAASDQEKEKCREYNLREAEYYDKRAELDSKWKSVSVPSKPLYVSEDGDVWIPDNDVKEDKVVKWQLPLEVDGMSGEYYIQFPDDLMEAAGIKEDDLVEWIDIGGGSFELRKVTKPIKMEEC
jgi:hypothetical protein